MFVCAIETLHSMLINDKGMSGVEVPGSGGRCLKVIGYRDDVTKICKIVARLRRVKLLIFFVWRVVLV